MNEIRKTEIKSIFSNDYSLCFIENTKNDSRYLLSHVLNDFFSFRTNNFIFFNSIKESISNKKHIRQLYKLASFYNHPFDSVVSCDLIFKECTFFSGLQLKKLKTIVFTGEKNRQRIQVEDFLTVDQMLYLGREIKIKNKNLFLYQYQ